MEVLRWTWVLLTQSFWGVIVPSIIWIWDWVIAGLLWLLIGGFASAPLVVWGAKKLCRRFRNGLVETGIWVSAALALWLYAHLWTASAMLWTVRVGMAEGLEPGCWVLLAIFWFVEAVFAVIVWAEESSRIY